MNGILQSYTGSTSHEPHYSSLHHIWQYRLHNSTLHFLSKHGNYANRFCTMIRRVEFVLLILLPTDPKIVMTSSGSPHDSPASCKRNMHTRDVSCAERYSGTFGPREPYCFLNEYASRAGCAHPGPQATGPQLLLAEGISS